MRPDPANSHNHNKGFLYLLHPLLPKELVVSDKLLMMQVWAVDWLFKHRSNVLLGGEVLGKEKA